MYRALSTLVMLLLVRQNRTLVTTGFDCGIIKPNRVNISSYSLLEEGSCKLSRKNIVTRNFTGIILQNEKVTETNVFQCKVKLSREVKRCSWLGYLEPVENGLQEYLIDITKEQCKRMHDTHTFIYDSAHILYDLKVNETTRRSIYLAGNAVDNSCNNGPFSDRFGSWSRVIVQGMFAITLRSYKARVNLQTERVILDNGITCNFNDYQCFGSNNGFTFWRMTHKESCHERNLELLYKGLITEIVEIRPHMNITRYIVDQYEYLILLKGSVSFEICGNVFVKTDYKDIFVFEGLYANFPFKRVNVDMVKYFNNKIAFTDFNLKKQMGDLYENLIIKRCEAEMMMIKEQLALARISPNIFAFNLLGYGFSAYTTGDVIHIVKCQPVEVVINPNPRECYDQIPILYNGKNLFLSTITRTIIKHATLKTCNKILPVEFNVDGTWISFTPELKFTTAPKLLNPEMKESWSPKEIKDLDHRGMYSEQDVEDFMEKLNFPEERHSILETTAVQIRNHVEKSDGSDDYFGKWYIEAMEKKFEKFGIYSAGLFAVILIFYCIVTILNVVIRGLALHRVFGLSYKIGAAILSSLTHMALISRISKFSGENKDDDVPDVRVDTMSKPDSQTTDTRNPNQIPMIIFKSGLATNSQANQTSSMTKKNSSSSQTSENC